MDLATTIALNSGGQGSGRHKGSGKLSSIEKVLIKNGYVHDTSLVNSPYGKAYRHPKNPSERVHVMNEDASADYDAARKE